MPSVSLLLSLYQDPAFDMSLGLDLAPTLYHIAAPRARSGHQEALTTHKPTNHTYPRLSRLFRLETQKRIPKANWMKAAGD